MCRRCGVVAGVREKLEAINVYENGHWVAGWLEHRGNCPAPPRGREPAFNPEMLGLAYPRRLA